MSTQPIAENAVCPRLSPTIEPAPAGQRWDDIRQALARALPVSHEQRQAEFWAAMRYRSALGSWYANLFGAARRGEPFDRPRPQPQDFEASRFGGY